MGGRMSRGKGRRGEREIVTLLQPVVNEVYAACGIAEENVPVLKRNSLQSDGGGSDIAGLPWLALEVKYQEQQNSYKHRIWWEQTLEQAGMERVPVLFYRRNKVRWQVMMFGMLGGPGWGYSVPVLITPGDFLLWFRARLHQELSK